MLITSRRWIFALVVSVLVPAPLQAQPANRQPIAMPSHQFKAASEQASFEWFFLVVDAGKEQGIWTRNGLDPEFVAAAGSSGQLKAIVASGVATGFVNAAE